MADIPRNVQRQIDALKRPFTAFRTRFAALSQDRATLAPQFMRVYGAYLRSAGGTFVSFVRLLDPTVPAERSAYRANPSYQAADYLRRLVSRRDAAGTNRTPATRSNLTALARLLATIVPLVRDPQVIWRAVETEFQFSARQVGRLRQVTNETRPLLTLQNARPSIARPIHIERPVQQEAA